MVPPTWSGLLPHSAILHVAWSGAVQPSVGGHAPDAAIDRESVHSDLLRLKHDLPPISIVLSRPLQHAYVVRLPWGDHNHNRNLCYVRLCDLRALPHRKQHDNRDIDCLYDRAANTVADPLLPVKLAPLVRRICQYGGPVLWNRDFLVLHPGPSR